VDAPCFVVQQTSEIVQKERIVDALSEVLSSVRLKSTMWVCSQAAAPWGLSLPEARSKCATRSTVRFHYLTRGSCWLSVDKHSEPRIALSGGDLVMLPLGHGHQLRDQPRSAATKVEGPQDGESVLHLRIGGTGPETTMLCGAFEIDDPSETPLLSTLPPLIRITPDAGQAVPSVLQNLQFIAREAESNRPGSQIVRTRMAEVMFVQVLRAYIESLPDGTEGFLGALRDTHVGSALGLMHRQLEEQWTVASLASKVGLSRSAFAARFTQLVGEPPLGYLTRLRMQKATALLRGGATLAKTSQMTGYSSDAAFSHAFRQYAGVAPGAYRRQTRTAASSEAD
jgi:AraC-like DNA-binding protein